MAIYKMGTKVASWTIKQSEGKKGYLCECKCGTVQIVSTGNLRAGKSTQCRKCQYAPTLSPGDQCNDRTVVSYEGHGLYQVRCDNCDKVTSVTKSQFGCARCRCFMKNRVGHNHPASKLVEHDGKTHNINEWLEIAGISREAYRVRKSNGWTDYAALFTPKGQKPAIEIKVKKTKKASLT